MNSYPLTTLWLKILTVIALEVGVVALLFALVQRWCRTAVWRRTLCQAAVITSLVLTFSELSGTGRTCVALFLRPPKNPWDMFPTGGGRWQEAPANQPQLDPVFRSQVISRLARNQAQISDSAAETSPSVFGAVASELPVTAPHSPITDSTAMLWLWAILGIVAAFLAGRACLGRMILVFLGLRRRAFADTELLGRVDLLARNLDFSRRVRIIESPRLLSPIAFGLFRPTIGLPMNFCGRFSAAKQEAILTHELAHLAAHDPFWQFVADFVAAFLWWHPGSWWLRRQLRLSSELAADEASLMRAGGPRILAECLVEMGAQLAKPALGHFRVAGFRSDLGCRVQRLMRLEGAQWAPVSRVRAVLARSLAPIFVAATVILCTAWAVPRDLTKGDSMKTMKQNWQRALATIATMAAIQTPTVIVAQQNPTPTAATSIPVNAAQPTPATSISVSAEPPTAATSIPVNAVPLAQNAPGPGAPGTLTAQNPGLPPGENASRGAVNPSTEFSRFRAPSVRAANPVIAEGMADTPPHGGRLEAKLREIVLDEVKFEGLPLSEVLNFLSDESRKRDSEKKGINFLINPNPPNQLSSGPIDPTTGLPLPTEAIDVASTSVKFNMPLRHVPMADVLDAIVRVADRPIQYTVEDYAVIFSLRPEANAMAAMAGRSNTGPAPLAVRTFHVDTNTFVAGLESAFGIKVETKGKGDSRKIQSALKELLVQLNVSMDGNKAIFYNELTGTVMVRVAAEDVDVIQAAIETLGGQPTGSYAVSYGQSSVLLPPGYRR
jgi:beta-lactamase regulating signal transducer with metallopeptidase domain